MKSKIVVVFETLLVIWLILATAIFVVATLALAFDTDIEKNKSFIEVLLTSISLGFFITVILGVVYIFLYGLYKLIDETT